MATTETKTNLSASARAVAKAANTNLAGEIRKLGLPKKETDALLKKVSFVGKAAEAVVNAAKKLETELKAANKLVADAGKKKAAADKVAQKAAAAKTAAASKPAAAKPATAKAAPKAATPKVAAAPKVAAPKATKAAPKKAAAKPAADSAKK